MPPQRERAVVLGASIGGLLAARVLADFYRTVTVVERDALPPNPANRRGVPQGKHPHALLGRGVEIIDELFPGLFDRLVADGAVKWSDGDLSRFWSTFGGHLLIRSSAIPDPASLVHYHLSRPLLESSVRREVSRLPNVKFLEEHNVVSLTADDGRRRVTGVRLRRGGGIKRWVAADLIVDASGRGSRMPTLLGELGYRPPPVDEVKAHIAYATLPVRIPRGMLRELVLMIHPVPSRPTTFAMSACENDTYMVLGGTVGGQDPPADRAALLDFIAEFAPRHAVAAARAAEPLGEVSHYRIPSSRWRRYDKVAPTPDGLLVIGDAVCSFNPIYGQGMTIAAIETEILRDCVRRRGFNLPQRFFQQCADKIQVAWRMTVGSDLALPQVPGRRSMSTRITNAYLAGLLTATETDPVVAQEFLRVAWMLEAPTRLFLPATVLRTAKALMSGARNPEQMAHLAQLRAVNASRA